MPTEPTPPEQWPINNYWQVSNERISQHWYISFCLMMSAVQDYLTGLVLEGKDNLNWATTCYYYSMVHTGRLTVFCKVGDFPTGHGALRNLLNNGQANLDWLNSKFLRDSGTHTSLQWRESNEQIDIFSQKLSRLGELRTDANYESLIIAHEKKHKLVTDGFTRLVNAAGTAASEAVSIAINSYKSYVNTSPLLDARRGGFKIISNQYVTGRMYIALIEKVETSNEGNESLESLRKSLEFEVSEIPENSQQAGQIEEQIMLEQFESKQSLMKKFLEKIRSFENVNKIRAEE